MIYHITTLQWWEKWTQLSVYESETLHQEGFIHCCEATQIAMIVEKYFAGKTDLLLLQIDPAKLSAELKYEIAPHGEIFPHIYGAIHKNAIVNVSSKS